MKNHQLRIVVAIIIAFVFVESAMAQLPELVKKNEQAIFTIYTYDEYGSPSGMATGFFIDSKGTAITNHHVLDGAYKAVIKLTNDKKYEIKKILSDNPDADLVRFMVDNPTNEVFNFLNISNTLPEKGQKIFVIGNPEGFESTVSEGIVSSIREVEGFGNTIQITAPISHGSSGSPIMTMEGNVIAIVSFMFNEGQNLNFGIPGAKISELKTLTNSKDISSISSDIVIINAKCEENSELILNSIEFKPDKTIVNFSFTNVSIGYGPSMAIWTERNKGDDGFFIQDIETKEKYLMTSATIGTSRFDGTMINLGETIRFNIVFDKLPTTVKKINLMEGLASSWTFVNLNLDNYRIQNGKDVTDYQKNLALTKLTSKDYTSATEILSQAVKENSSDEDAYNIMGIISYVIDNKYDAVNYFTKAIEINPKNDIYYFNRVAVYNLQGKVDEALMDITLAIKLRPTQGDYFQMRGYIYQHKKEWQKAINDFDVAINLMGEVWTLYRYRGLCKSWLSDSTGACNDWKKAYKLTEYKNVELSDWIKKYCK